MMLLSSALADQGCELLSALLRLASIQPVYLNSSLQEVIR